MAFVILSSGTLTRSTTRTLSIGFVAVAAVVCMLLMLAAGVALGYAFSRGSGEVVVVEETIIEVPVAVASDGGGDNRLWIDRFGELSGRMIQLEAEALDLAFRIGVIKEFEARLTPQERAAAAGGRVARTQPGAGGPLLDLRGRKSAEPAGALPGSEKGAAQLTDELSRMEGDIGRLSDVLEDLDRVVVSLNLAHMSFPGRQPVKEVLKTSSFGNRIDPFTKRRAFHSGVDFPAPTGTPIHASAGGKVIWSGYRAHYGNTVEIDHGAGLVTRYAHASKLLVKKGQIVMPGETIARVGSTGRSTGPHLHFEILKDGRFVDPTIYLARF